MEKELVALLKTHDQNALKKIFDLYHSSLCVLAYTVVKDKDQAKDIVQEVFIKLWKNRERLEITVSLGAYLKRATVNTSLNYIENTYTSNKQPLEKSDLAFYTQNTTDQSMAYNELAENLDSILKQLPSRTRAVFRVIRSEEMSYKEAAIALNISIKAVEKEMMKALRILREKLKDYLHSWLILLMVYVIPQF